MLVNLEILWREIWGNFVKIALICTNHLCCNPRDSERQNWTYRWMAPQGHSYSNGNLLDWSWISIFGQFSSFFYHLIWVLQLQLYFSADMIIPRFCDLSSRHLQWTMWPKLGEFPIFLRSWGRQMSAQGRRAHRFQNRSIIIEFSSWAFNTNY